MAGPWDVVSTEQPPRPPQPAPRGTPAATALGGTTTATPAAPPRAPQAAAAAGAPIDRGRPAIANPDGSISTERTITIGADGRFFNIPTIVGGRQLSEDQAIKEWRGGRNKAVGEFATQAEAEQGAKARSDQIGQQRPSSEWDVVSNEPLPAEPRQVGFGESAGRVAASAAIPVVRTLGLGVAGVLEAMRGGAEIADAIAPIFGVKPQAMQRLQAAQDRVFQEADARAASMRDAYAPKAGEEFDTLGSIAGGVASMPIEVAGGFGLQRGIERSADVLERGGSMGDAAIAGGVSGAANVASNLLPVKAGGAAGRVIEQGLGKMLPGGARAGAVAGGAVSGGALGAGADLAVAGAENVALPAGEAFTDLQREADPTVSGGLGAALGAGAAAIATRGKGRARPAPKPQGSTVGAAEVDAATTRRERARNLPVPVELTEGQAGGKFDQQQFEKETAKDASTGKPLRETFDEQNARIRQNLDALQELTGAEAPEVRGAGKRVVDALVNKASQVKGEVDAEYKKAREAGEMAEEVDTTALVTKLREIEPSKGNAGVIAAAEAELVRLGGAKRSDDGSLVPAKLSLDKLEELRKKVGVNGGKDATNAHFAREIKDTIDLTTEDAGGDLYRGARQKYKAYAQEFKARKIVAQLIENKRGTDERKVALEDVYSKSIKDGSVDEIVKLRDTLRGAGLEGQQAWRELQGQVIADIRDATFKNVSKNERGDRIASVAGMDRVIRDLDKDGKLDLVFGKKGGEILRDLRDLTADVHSAPAGSVNHSNTASALRNFVDTLATYGLTGLPIPARETMVQIGRMLRSRGVKKKVLAAIPKGGQPQPIGTVKPGLFEPPPPIPPAPGAPAPRQIPTGSARELPPGPPATGRAPDLPRLPTPEVIEDTAPRIPTPEVIEGQAALPAGEARELGDDEFKAWQREHRFGGLAADEALKVDRAMQIDPDAVERAATQHARQPGSFARVIAGILEKGKTDATDTPGAARSSEGLPGQGDGPAGDRQGEGTQAAAAAEEARLNRTSGETEVAAAIREFEKATAPTGNPITDALGDKLRTDYSRAVQEYSEHPDTKGGTVLNTDIARELSADYLADRTRSADVHEPASAFVKRLYAEKLAGPTPEGTERRVMFTAGGTGAGKTTAVNQLTAEDGTPEITYDTNMNSMASSVKKIEQALAAGREVRIAFVYADPLQAFEQAIGRANRQKAKFGSGRTVPIADHADTHIGVAKVIRELAEKYKDDPRVGFTFIDNSRGRGNAAVVDLREIPVVSDNGLRESLEAAAREAHRSARIDDATLAGFLGQAAPARPEGLGQALRRGAEPRGPGGQVDAAAHAAATSPHNDLSEPSDAQKAAGNYKKGHVRVGGLDLSIENPEGSTRSGHDRDGNPWTSQLKAHYGYLRGSKAADGDHLDVFIKPGTPPDFDGMVYVVDQVEPSTGKFDEHKAVLGAADEADARAIYAANYPADWKGLRNVTTLPLPAFKAWAESPAAKRPLRPIDPSLQDDLQSQQQFLESRAKAAGHASIDAWAEADMDSFLRAAEQWRARNPAGSLA
jgi:hypothetical protein